MLDNFCWGNPERPETLGSLVLAARACRDLALAYRTPFISGKDSLYNEYAHDGRSLAIPGTLLISALGQVPDIRQCVSMDLKAPGNALLLLGATDAHLGGSIWASVRGLQGGRVPRVDANAARKVFGVVHQLIRSGLVRSCHDLSDGGLAVALAEMALAGGLGGRIALNAVPRSEAGETDHDATLLFSESPSRFLLEVRQEDLNEVLRRCDPHVPVGRIGEVTGESEPRLTVIGKDGSSMAIDVADRANQGGLAASPPCSWLSPG